MAVRIVTDSTCDLPTHIVEEYGITVLPCYINIGQQSYLDGVELSRAEFYTMLPGLNALPTTSAPSLGSFIQAYEGLAAAGATEIVSVHISPNLSNVFNVAQLAAQSVEGVPVQVLEAGNLTLATGFAALAAAQAAQAGASVAKVIETVQDMAKRTYTYAALDTLEFIRRSGRLNQFQAALGTLLGIKPILKMNGGQIDMERVRTSRNAYARLIRLITDIGPLEHLALVHAHTLDKVEVLRQLAGQLFPPSDKSPLCVEVTPVIGAHVGPGTVGFVAVGAAQP